VSQEDAATQRASLGEVGLSVALGADGEGRVLGARNTTDVTRLGAGATWAWRPGRALAEWCGAQSWPKRKLQPRKSARPASRLVVMRLPSWRLHPCPTTARVYSTSTLIL